MQRKWMLPWRSFTCLRTSGAEHFGGCQFTPWSRPTRKLSACALAAKPAAETVRTDAMMVDHLDTSKSVSMVAGKAVQMDYAMEMTMVE
jgi:hypothetical protein